MLTPVLVTPPADRAVSLEEVKAQLDYPDSDRDEHILSLLEAAIAHYDGYSGILGRALVTQAWKFRLNAWPCSRIDLPLVPVQSVSSVKYWSTTQLELATSNYRVHTDGVTPYLTWTTTASLPSYDDRDDAIEVQFVAGYGAPKDVPADIKAAIKLHVERHYGALTPEEIATFERTEMALISKYRRIGV